MSCGALLTDGTPQAPAGRQHRPRPPSYGNWDAARRLRVAINLMPKGIDELGRGVLGSRSAPPVRSPEQAAALDAIQEARAAQTARNWFIHELLSPVACTSGRRASTSGPRGFVSGARMTTTGPCLQTRSPCFPKGTAQSIGDSETVLARLRRSRFSIKALHAFGSFADLADPRPSSTISRLHSRAVSISWAMAVLGCATDLTIMDKPGP